MVGPCRRAFQRLQEVSEGGGFAVAKAMRPAGNKARKWQQSTFPKSWGPGISGMASREGRRRSSLRVQTKSGNNFSGVRKARRDHTDESLKPIDHDSASGWRMHSRSLGRSKTKPYSGGSEQG